MLTMTQRVCVLVMIDDASIGGGQQHILLLTKRLDRTRFDVAVACEGDGYLVDELRKRGILTHPLRMSNRPSIRSLFECVRLYRKWKPDIVHTHGGTAGFLGRIASLFVPGIRRVHTYHGIHYLHNLQRLQNRIYWVVDRGLKHCTDRLVCVARSDYELGIRYGVVDREKTMLIRNGIDVEKFASAKRESAIKTGAVRIVGTIGRLHAQKGHCFLLEAAARVIKNDSTVVFHIVGEGELQSNLEGQIRSLGLQGRVKLLGVRTDVPGLLAGMDIFVLPSLWEGLPLVLLEAMAARKPIVATAVDGVKEVIADDEALLVPPRDPERLADAILQILHDPGLAGRLGESAYRKVKSEFNVEVMVKQIEQLYESITKR